MAAETAPIRDKTRRVKDHILTRYLAFAEKIDQNKKLTPDEFIQYNELTSTFARNVLPRSVEHGGDPENEMPIPILMRSNVPTNNSNPEDKPAPETD